MSAALQVAAAGIQLPVAQSAANTPVSLPTHGNVTVPLFVRLTMAAPTQLINFRTQAALAQRYANYEFCELVSIKFEVTIGPGATRVAQWAYTTSDTTPAHFQAESYAGQVNGHAHGAIKEVGELDPGHGFGRLLKGVNLGNPSPILHLNYSGGTAAATSADVWVKVWVTFAGRGAGIQPANTVIG